MILSNCIPVLLFLFLIHYFYFDFAKCRNSDDPMNKFIGAYKDNDCSQGISSKFEYGLVHIQTLDGRFLDTCTDANDSITFVVTADKKVTMSQVWRIEKINGYNDCRFSIHLFNDSQRAVSIRDDNSAENDQLILGSDQNKEHQQFILHNGHIKSIKNPDIMLTASNGQSNIEQDNKVSLKHVNKNFSQKWQVIPMQEEYCDITKTKIIPNEPVVLQNGGKYMDLQFDIANNEYVIIASEKSIQPLLSQTWIIEETVNSSFQKSFQRWYFKSNYKSYILDDPSQTAEPDTRLIVHQHRHVNVNQKFYYTGGMIKSGKDGNMVLTVKKTTANGQTHEIILQRNTGNADQIWMISKAPNSTSNEIAVVDSSRKDDDGRSCPDVMDSKLIYGLVNIKTLDGKYLDTFYNKSENKTFLVAADKSASISQIWRIQKHGEENKVVIFSYQNHSEKVDEHLIYEKGMLKLEKNRTMILTVATTTGSSNEICYEEVFLKDIKKQCNQKWKIVPVEDSYLSLIRKDDLLNKPVVIKNAFGFYLDVKYSFNDKIYYAVANGNIKKAGSLWKIEKTDDNHMYFTHIGTNQVLNDTSTNDTVGTRLITSEQLKTIKPTFLYDGGMIKSATNNNNVLTIGDGIHLNERNNDIIFQENIGHLSQMWSIVDAEAEYSSVGVVQDKVSDIKVTAFQAEIQKFGKYPELELNSRINKKANVTIHTARYSYNVKNVNSADHIWHLRCRLYKFEDTNKKFAVLFNLHSITIDCKKMRDHRITESLLKKLTFYSDVNGRNFEIKYEGNLILEEHFNCSQNRRHLAKTNYYARRFEGILEAKNDFECQFYPGVAKFSFQVLTIKPEIEVFTYTYSPILGNVTLNCSIVESLLNRAQQNISLYYNEDLLISKNESSAWTILHKNASDPGIYRCVVSSKYGMDEASLKVTVKIQENNFKADDGVLIFKAKPYSKSVEIKSTLNESHEFSCVQIDKQMFSTGRIGKKEALKELFYDTVLSNNEFHCFSKTGDDFEFEAFV